MPRHDGGSIVGEVLARRGATHLFTLCGGHISPLLVGAKAHGLGVIDMRGEASAVFAADAAARLSGGIGVAAVTAGPGVTNAITAMKNAELAQSPVLLLGGATATVLKGRGALQDIDQLALLRPTTKFATSVKTLAALGPTVDKAIDIATSGIPGPVFVEIPVDLLYPEDVVKDWYLKESSGSGIGARALQLYLRGHLFRQFHAPHIAVDLPQPKVWLPGQSDRATEVAEKLVTARKPVLVLGSQSMVGVDDPRPIAEAIEALGIPTYLAGMARGLLGRNHPLQLRHHRGKALKEADLVIVAGFPFDFRLGYGRGISRKAEVVAINLSSEEMTRNRRPELAVRAHPGRFLVDLAAVCGTPVAREPWQGALREREDARDAEIAAQAGVGSERVHPLAFFRRLEDKMADDAVLVVDGGDFVATGAYVLRPRAPLSWLDPGAFGTLGVGGGFAVGAAACRPGAQIWLLYGDGSSAYSLAEIDTCVRHGFAPIAVVGNDGSWAQIARDQVDLLGDDVGTTLLRCDYHEVAKGYGGVGLLLDDPADIDARLDEAIAIAAGGRPVVLNVHIETTDFRKGSLSM